MSAAPFEEAWRQVSGPPRIDFRVLPGEDVVMRFALYDSDETGERRVPWAESAHVLIGESVFEGTLAASDDGVVFASVVVPSVSVIGGSAYTLLVVEGGATRAYASGVITRTPLVT